MSDFFEQKQNSVLHFRTNINRYIKESNLISLSNQLDAETIQNLFQSSRNPLLMNNGRIHSEELYETLRNQDGGHVLNKSDFQTIFGSKREIKISEISSLLKKYDLQSFDFEAQTRKYFFDKANQFKVSSMAQMMKNQGWPELNLKNKQIMSECFDFNNDKKINIEDLQILMELLKEERKRNDKGDDEDDDEEQKGGQGEQEGQDDKNDGQTLEQK